jgi:nitroreductase
MHNHFMKNGRRTVDQLENSLIVRFHENRKYYKTASTAPSGAHKQPWTFIVVANPEIKKTNSVAAEEEEQLATNRECQTNGWMI